MTYRVQLLNGLFRPYNNRYRLKKAEEITNFGLKVLSLYILSLLVYTISGSFGIGLESVSRDLSEMDAGSFEMSKAFAVLGRFSAGIVFASIFIFLSSLFFWIFTDIEYMKIATVQLIVFCLSLLEKAVSIPLFVLMDINQDSNPLSLGVIGQYVTGNEYLIHFLGEITLFQIVIIALQTYYLSYLTEGNKRLAIFGIGMFYLIVWLLSALLAYIKVDVFI
ncbi:hypothetical protein [Peribacillus sp. SCS-155]|uniref:hypothetical protein n=1 Tax=Peribacillus sedimenti TaxID=3115297 RepID=UPI003906CB1C